jgi:hypothetical protein
MCVVDAQPGEGRHQVLDGIDLGVTLEKPRAHARVAHRVGVGGQVDDRIEIDPMETRCRYPAPPGAR